MQANRSQDLARTTFQLLAIGALVAASFWIVRPFLVAMVWATMIVVSTWPLLLYVQGWLGGRRAPAVAVMTAALLLILVVPLYFGTSAIVENGRRLVDWAQSLATFHIPALPPWVESIPVVGARIAARWHDVTATRPEEIAARLAPHARTFVVWLAGQIGGIGVLLVQFLLTVLIAAVLYANGEMAGRAADRFTRRLAGARGENAVHLARQAIRGIALGVVVTAILQSALAGLGLAVVGVPFATIFTAVMFLLCIAQVGPGLVLIPAVIWVFATRGGAWGTGFLIWALFCMTLDNFVRPALIRRGADLPLLLIFTGVIGGLIAFGIIGLFIGPVVLAVAYTLLVDWVSAGDAPEERGAPLPAARDAAE
jgi:predicted PurR-regulated permease PerM